MRSKRLLATLLTLTMIVSGVPSAAIAAETGDITVQAEEQQYNDVEAQDSVEDGVAADVTEVPAETAEESTPAETVSEEAAAAGEEVSAVEEVPEEVVPEAEQMTFEGRANGVKVYVEAPAGAFEEGTIMTVKKASAQDVIDAIKESDEIDIQVKTVKAVDITFSKDGEEVQPALPISVKLTSDLVAETEAPIVVHVDDEGVAEEMKEAEPVEGEDNAITFEAEHFSVYAIISGDEEITPIITYHFLDGAGNPYPFHNKAGETVTTQIIKNGESLQEVPAPGLIGENAFNGWYYYNTETDEYGDQVVFNEAITVNETKDVYIKAHYGEVIYVTFYQYAKGGVVLERKQLALNNGKASMDMSSVTVPAPKTTLKFIGWSREPGTDASESDGDAVGSRPLLENGNVEFTQNTEVYPVYYTGVWIVFVSAQTGMGATYVPSYFITAGTANASGAAPSDPEMSGYTFEDWYTEEEPVEDYAKTESESPHGRKFDFNTTFENLRNYVNDRGEVVLYGHWKPGDTTYVVVYWKQQVDNSKTAQDSEKTYDYAGQTDPITATTGSNPTPTTAQQAADSGFEYKRYQLVDVDNEGNSTPSSGLKADGSTILNVYFDRKLIKLKFYRNGNSTQAPGYTSDYYNTDTDTARVTVFTGLYGQTLAFNNYTWPSGTWRYYTTDNALSMSYLGEFVLPGDERDTTHSEMRLYYTGNSSRTVTFYVQNADTTYPTSGMPSVGVNYNTHNFSDKYEGFKVIQYRVNNGNWVNVSSTDNADGTHTYSPRYVEWNSGTLSIRYARIPYEIKFLNPLNENPVLDPQTVLYGASLSNVKPNVSEIDLGVSGYEWDGKWYKDKLCTEEFDFTTETMPLNGTKVYAGKKPIYFYIKIDPNGGELQTGQATWRWVLYGDTSTYTYDNITREYIEYKGSGQYYQYYYDEFDESRRDEIWNYTYMASNPRTARYVTGPDQIPEGGGLEWLGSERYSKEADAYGLIGWYDITDGVENMKPFKTGTAITRDTVIQAQWRRTGEYHVLYGVEAVDESGNPLMKDDVPVMGWNSPSDSATYADKSDSSIMDKMKGVPAGYEFIGWWYNDKMYEPGDVFQVLAKLSDDQSTVHIYPVLKAVETIPVEVIDITFDPNGGEFTEAAERELNDIIAAITDAETGSYAPEVIWNEEAGTYSIKNLKINEGLDLLSEAAVVQNKGVGYRLIGWSKDKDDQTDYFTLDTKVGVDNEDPIPNVLYAVWEKFFFVYHSGIENDDNNKALEEIKWDQVKNGKFDITKKVTDGTLYGGYYSAYGNSETGEKYTGGLEIWNSSEAYTEIGTDMTPYPGTIYYLKEVPETYLRPSNYEIYHKGTNGVPRVESVHYLVSAIDDLNYQDAGFIRTDDKGSTDLTRKNEDIDLVEKIIETYIKEYVEDLNDGETGTVIETKEKVIKDFFKKLEYGRLICYDNGVPDAGTSFTFQPFYVTYDGIKVTGTKKRTVTAGEEDPVTYDSISITNSTTGSKLSPFSAGPVEEAEELRSIKALSTVYDERENKPAEEGNIVITKIENGSSSDQLVGAGDNRGLITFSQKEGYFFAGWYSDSDFVTPADFSDVQAPMTVYARYIAESDVVISAVRKVKKSNYITVTGSVAFAEDVFQEAGFTYSFGTQEGTMAATSKSNVKINGKTMTKLAAVFTLNGINSGQKFTVTPYWVTKDGTVVTGNAKTFKYAAGTIVVV